MDALCYVPKSNYTVGTGRSDHSHTAPFLRGDNGVAKSNRSPTKGRNILLLQNIAKSEHL